MKQSIAMIMTLVVIAGSLSVLMFTQPTVRADPTLQDLWNAINDTRSDLRDVSNNVGSLSGRLDTITGKIDVINGNVLFIMVRMGYNSSDPSTYTIKSDFTRLYQALYATDGSSNLKTINDNQIVLLNHTDNIAGKIIVAETTINENTNSRVDGLTIQLITVIVVLIILICMVLAFFVWHKGRGPVAEVKAPAESLFVSPIVNHQPPQQTVEQAVDSFPPCFRIQFDPRSSDCRICQVRLECSGQPVAMKKYPIVTKRKR